MFEKASRGGNVRSAISEPLQIDERRLVREAQGGQATSFGTLCERHTQQLFRTAHRITRSREDAEDAVQDALLRAFVHVEEFDGRSTFATWLTRIAINSALMILRKKRSSLVVTIGSTIDFAAAGRQFQVADRNPNPEKRYAGREEKRILKKAIQKLRPSLRQVVNIQHLQDGSMRQTAETMGITVSAAKARLFHAKAALRKSSLLKLMRRRQAAGTARVLSAA